MKVKRFIASDMRTAMQQVRDSLGAEAVILSNRMIDEGVEILASNDYDSTMAQTQKPVKRSYRTYADIPDEPVEQRFVDDRVSFTQGQHQNSNTSAVKEKLGGLFDRRESPDESVSAFKHDQFNKSEPAIPQQPRAKTKKQKIDYSQFIDDEPVTDTQQQAHAGQQSETDSLKNELQALRSMMETQMSMMNWDKQKKQNPVKTGLLKRLTELGLTVDISKQVLDKVTNNNDAKKASKQAINELINSIPVASDDILKNQGIVALVGPTGVGKTTTIAKLAARFVMANSADQIALVTLDNYRIGAQEQLYNYARILNVPVHNAKDSNELHKVLQNLYDKSLILIDTAGMSQKDMRICEQFNTLKQGADEVRSYVVLSANAQTSALDEIISAFKQTEIAGCIFTKLDETTSLGGAISMLVRHKLPITYLSDGQAVPEDLRAAYARELVASALDLLKKRPEEVNETDLAMAFNEGQMHAH